MTANFSLCALPVKHRPDLWSYLSVRFFPPRRGDLTFFHLLVHTGLFSLLTSLFHYFPTFICSTKIFDHVNKIILTRTSYSLRVCVRCFCRCNDEVVQIIFVLYQYYLYIYLYVFSLRSNSSQASCLNLCQTGLYFVIPVFKSVFFNTGFQRSSLTPFLFRETDLQKTAYLAQHPAKTDASFYLPHIWKGRKTGQLHGDIRGQNELLVANLRERSARYLCHL